MHGKGLAKQQFVEKHRRSPWIPFQAKSLGRHPWPFLELFLAQQRVTYLDYDLTHRLLRNHPNASQEAALAICHLLIAAKEGHLCVQFFQDSMSPSVQALWHSEEGGLLSDEEARTITQLLLIGVKQIPKDLISTMDGKNLYGNAAICQEGNRFYLQRLWFDETLLLEGLERHLKSLPTITFDLCEVKQAIQRLLNEGKLNEEQAQAIILASSNTLTLVSGGPGTGKTYTAGHLIKICWEMLSNEQRGDYQIVIAAPTGKAAANLQQSLNRVVGAGTNFPAIQAKTLHALLNIKQFSHASEAIQLAADLIIVDECSMMDVRMMAKLFEALKPGSRLILLGDPHQLPAIEAGSIFADLINMQTVYPQKAPPCTSLSSCFRAELKTLTEFALMINQGYSQQALEVLCAHDIPGIKRLNFPEDKQKAQARLIEHAISLVPAVVHLGQRPEYLMDLFQAVRLLSPVRKGPFGVESLNQCIWQRICQTLPMNGYVAVPIIITANDYRQELFNGDAGVLIRRLPLHHLTAEDYAFFPSRTDNHQVRRLSAMLLPKHDLAYCLSVHKSQGSEFDHVILTLPEGSELFGREIFYTAVTRAKKSIEIYGSDSVIKKTIEHQGVRLSGLTERLIATLNHP